MQELAEFAIIISLLLGVTVGTVVTILHYQTKSDLKRLDRLVVSMKIELDYIRNLHQKDQNANYPKLYKKINQERKELETLLNKYRHKLEMDHYEEALKILHIVSALKPKGHFLTDVADGVLDMVNDFFPEAEKVTAMFRPKQTDNSDLFYDIDDLSGDEVLAKQRQIQQIAPEILEIYSKIQKNKEQISEKLEATTLGNKAELLAIHEGNMRNFEDVLAGYLKIKEDPNQYYNAKERLSKAEQTLHKVSESLTETLRQINENDMMNFEISLRLLQKEG